MRFRADARERGPLPLAPRQPFFEEVVETALHCFANLGAKPAAANGKRLAAGEAARARDGRRNSLA